MEQIYDLIIIGAGPAGLSSAIGAASAGLSFLVIDPDIPAGENLRSVPVIDGFPTWEGHSGEELADALFEQAISEGTLFKHETVEFLELYEPLKSIITDTGEYLSRAVILSLGMKADDLRSFGDSALPSEGISFNCVHDSDYFAEKAAAVIGSDRAAVESAIYLGDIARKVYLISEQNVLKVSKHMEERLFNCPNISFVPGYSVGEIIGEDQVEAAWIENVITKDERTIAIDGIVFPVEKVPNTQLVENILSLDTKGFIIAKEDCRSSVDLVYAAGDVRIKPNRSIISAICDGQTAIDSLLEDFFK